METFLFRPYEPRSGHNALELAHMILELLIIKRNRVEE